MKRSLIAGATAAGLLLTAFVSPAAVAADVQPSLTAECVGTAQSEAEAATPAAACGEDVEVLGGAGEGAALYAELGGSMRFKTSAVDPSVSAQATARTVLRPAGPSDYGWTGTQWAGYCDPTEYAEGCATQGVQRLVWQFDGVEILRDLQPEDITSAEFVAHGAVAWLDDVDCTPSRLELYDIPRISSATGWASTAAWTEDRNVGGMSVYAPACEQTPGYTGYFDFDATQLAVNAARADRSSVTVGVRSVDETCMTCGWNSFKPGATLIVRFNRAPLTPTDLGVGHQGSSGPCTGDTVLRTTAPYLTANIVDPDPGNGSTPAEPVSAPVTATFRIAAAHAPDVVLWEGSEPFGHSGEHHVSVPSGILGGGRYVWTVFGTDGGGLVGSTSAPCAFSIDIESPAAPAITPLVGGQAVYVENAERGGVGVPGSFFINSASDDVVKYRYGLSTSTAMSEVAATENTVISVTPTRAGPIYLTVEALDKAGNRSGRMTHWFDVNSVGTAPSPPAITVSGPTSYDFGDTLTTLVMLSEDAGTPYGTVTVKSGSTVVGRANFDERYEWLSLDGPALGAGTKTLTFTFQAFPGAPAWSTQRTVTVKPLAFSVSRSPSVSGTAQVGKTLTANRLIWYPAPTTVKYQWRADGRAVSGATSRTWTVPASAKGKKITVALTGSRTGYTTKTVVSPSTTTVKAGAFVAPRPAVTGTPKVGATLKAVRGTWSPQPSTVKYQWKVGGVAVRGATSYWFKVPASAKGKRVAVVVTGSRTSYVTKTVTSPLTSAVR